jgi:hypothetical protein
MYLFSDVFSLPVHFEFFAIFFYYLHFAKFVSCCVTSRHHPHPPPHPPGPHTVYNYSEPGRVKKELSEIFLINWQCSNNMQYLNNEY